MKSQMNTKALVEGSLAAALTAILALAGIYFPFMRLLTNLIWTIPILLVIVRYRFLTGLMSIFVAGVLISIMSSPIEALFLLLQFGGLALVYGYFLRKRAKAGFTIITGTAVVLISIIATLFLSYLIFGLASVDFAGAFKGSVDEGLKMYKEMGILEQYMGPGVTEETIRQDLYAVADLVMMLFPALLFISSLAIAVVNYLIAQKVFDRLKIAVPRLQPFIYWRLPWWIIWGFIVGFGANILGGQFANETVKTVGMNIMLAYFPVFIVLGWASVRYLLHKYLQDSLPFKFLLYFTVIFFFNYAMIILGVLGLFDLIFDYRHRSGEQ